MSRMNRKGRMSRRRGGGGCSVLIAYLGTILTVIVVAATLLR